jgi:hypothetical protein
LGDERRSVGGKREGGKRIGRYLGSGGLNTQGCGGLGSGFGGLMLVCTDALGSFKGSVEGKQVDRVTD